jgi:MinD-like ATPase involved in chromosome partitioning or flagellar assembly
MTNNHKIITFYSFKGGAGRSQLAVNLAAYLYYYLDKKILLLDWDLEAPGIDAYFKHFDRKTITRGLVDVFEDYVKLMQKETKLELKDLPFLDNSCIYSMLPNPNEQENEKNRKGKIDLIPAINYNRENYTHIINSFDWFDFYDRLEGKYYLESVKEQLKATEYDYIFIDSRTGLSDYSGICNIQLPDANVIVVAPTQQNLNGAKMMIDKITNSPYTKEQRPEPVILPILSRIDLSEEKLFVEWTNKFREAFETTITNSLNYINSPVAVATYIGDTSIRYVKELAYGENILFDENSNGITVGSVAEKFENILSYLGLIPVKEIHRKTKEQTNTEKIATNLITKTLNPTHSIAFLWHFFDAETDYYHVFTKYLDTFGKYNDTKIIHIDVENSYTKEAQITSLSNIIEVLTQVDLFVLCTSNELISSEIFPYILNFIDENEVTIDKVKILEVDDLLFSIEKLKKYNKINPHDYDFGEYYYIMLKHQFKKEQIVIVLDNLRTLLDTNKKKKG